MHRRKVEVPWNGETLDDYPTDAVAEMIFADEMRIAGNPIRFENRTVAVVCLRDVAVKKTQARLKTVSKARRVKGRPWVFPAVIRFGQNPPCRFVSGACRSGVAVR